MKGKIFCFVVLAAFACSKKSEPTPEPAAETMAQEKKTPVNEQDCFARKEEKWFISFNKYQDDGDSMEVADKKALADANKEFEDCMAGKGNLSSETK